MPDGMTHESMLAASETVAEALGEKPRLLVDRAGADATVDRIGDVLAGADQFYDRGVPVRLIHDQMERGIVAQPMTPESVIMAVHRVCRPFEIKVKDGEEIEIDVQLPRSI